jgi:DNA mismatch repair protein MutS2
MTDHQSQNIPMPFTPGDDVLVTSLGKGVIREVRRGGRYLVEIKGRTLIVHEEQLERLDARKLKRRSTLKRAPDADRQAPHRSRAPAQIDLHGMRTDEAITALDSFLNDAMLAGHDQLRVIHGRGGGRIKSAVQAHLKRIPSVSYRLDPRNPGVTIVTTR